jgi:hypothetical protein
VQTAHARLLAEGKGGMTGDAIAEYNIILYVSIALVFISYFSTMAMVNMVSVPAAPRRRRREGKGPCVSGAASLSSTLRPRRGGLLTARSPPPFTPLPQDFGNDSLLYAKSKSD